MILSYRRIFYHNRTLRVLCNSFLVILVLQAISFMIASGKQCGDRNWGVWYQEWTLRHKCASAGLVWVGYSISDVVTDLVILALPIRLIWGLQMGVSKRISVVGMLGLGLL